MSNKPMDTALFDRAAVFAIQAHANTERRGKGFPYIIHAMEAAEIVASITSDQELIAAAILHDTLEDSSATYEDIARIFNEHIASLVAFESDIEVDESVPAQDAWFIRKKAALANLQSASYEEKVVVMGDKLSNMRAIARDFKHIGADLWNRFTVKDPAAHEWRYRSLAEALKELDGTDAYAEFCELIEETFAK